MNSETGKWIILSGLCVVAIGIIIYFFHDKLNWIGHLPGDISVEKENSIHKTRIESYETIILIYLNRIFSYY